MSSSQGTTQLDSLTGLRFVAALLVFVHHVPDPFPLFEPDGLADKIIAPLGVAGVGFFYVLSGFILTWVYSQRTEAFSIRDFYVKRIARIWPLHLATMLIVLFGVVTVARQLSLPNGVAKLVSNIFLLQTWWPTSSWNFSVNGPSWSLSNEAFFYFVFPWLLAGGAAAFRKKFVMFAMLIVAALVALVLLPQSIIAEETIKRLIHAHPLFRLFDFVVGMACGFMFVDRCNRVNQSGGSFTNRSSGRAAFIHVASLGACVGYYVAIAFLLPADVDGRWFSPIAGWLSVSGSALCFAFAIYVFARNSSRVSRLLGSRVMVYLGEISFAFYLIHQAILVVLSRQTLADSPWAMWWLVVAAFLMSLAAAMLLHHLVELPSRISLIQLMSTKNGSQTLVNRVAVTLSNYVRATWQLVSTPIVVLITALAVAGASFAQAGCFNYRDSNLIHEIVDSTAPRFRNIRFDQDAVLLGLSVEPQPDESYRVQMVWDLKEDRRPIRFLHICDSNGKLLRHGNANRVLFSRETGNVVVLDRVTVTADQLESARMFAIGFYGPERKSSPIADRRPGEPTHRLPILRLD